MIRASVTPDPIRPERVLEDLSTAEDGAVLLFLGVVRNHHQGKKVEGLVYEAYREMAEETLALIAAEAGERFGTDRVTVLHRIGALEVGEVSTAIGVATPHREEGYGASRYIIEEIKKRLPVWKLERYVDGDSGWVEGRIPPVKNVGEDVTSPGGLEGGPLRESVLPGESEEGASDEGREGGRESGA